MPSLRLTLDLKEQRCEFILINPSDVLLVSASSRRAGSMCSRPPRPPSYGDPDIVDETLEQLDPRRSSRATSSASASTPATPCAATRSGALRASAGASVVFGGIHATLYPEEAHELGGAHAVVKGDGDVVWAAGAGRLRRRAPRNRVYEGGRVDGDAFLPARWDLLPSGQLHVGVGADRARLPEALLVLLGLAHRRPATAPARRRRRHRGDRRAAARWASGSSRWPTTTSIRSRSTISRWRGARTTRAARTSSRSARRALRADGAARRAAQRHDLLHADHHGGRRRPRFLDAMREARIKGALVGVEVGDRGRPEGRLQGFQPCRRRAGRRGCGRSRSTACTCSGSFIFGLPTRSRGHVRRHRRARRAGRADVRAVRDADAVPRHGRFRDAGKRAQPTARRAVDGVPMTRYWLIPGHRRPKLYTPHPTMSPEEIRGAHAGRLGSVLQPAEHLGAGRLREVVRSRAWRSCSSRSSTGRCTPTPASRPTARAASGQPVGAMDRHPCRRLFRGQADAGAAVPRIVESPLHVLGQ